MLPSLPVQSSILYTDVTTTSINHTYHAAYNNIIMIIIVIVLLLPPILCRPLVCSSLSPDWALHSPFFHMRQTCIEQVVSAGTTMPAWLPVMLKQRLTKESHHKVLRRLLHLLAALPIGPPAAIGTVHANSSHLTQSDGQHSAGVTDDTDVVCSSTESCQSPASQAADAHAQDRTVSESVSKASAPSTSSSQTSLQASGTAVQTTGTVSRAQDHAGDAVRAVRAVHAGDVGQEFEQVHTLVMQASQPSVRREGLKCLGSAVWSVIARLRLPVNTEQSSPVQLSHHPSSPSSAQRCEQASSQADSERIQATGSQQHHSGSAQDQALSAESAQDNDQSSFGQDREGEQRLYTMVDEFVSLLSVSSRAQQFDDIRLAAATALQASGQHLYLLFFFVYACSSSALCLLHFSLCFSSFFSSSASS